MQAENDLLQCPKCQAHIFSSIFQIHTVMCKKPKQKKGFFQSLFQSKKSEEQAMIPCTQCGDSIPFSLYAFHQNQCVGHQLTLCKACGIKFPTFLFEEHRGVCEGKMLGNLEDQGSDIEENEAEVLEGMIQTVAVKRLDNQEGLKKSQVDSLPVCKVESEEDCPICCTGMKKKQKAIKLNCSHLYHARCISAWLGKNPLCPMCRSHALQK